MSRAITLRAASLVVAVLLASSCMTVRRADPHGPDPRAALPPLAAAAPALPTIATVVQTSDADPIIDVRLVFSSGAADDPGGHEGLTALSARLMAEATQALNAAQLQTALFPMAAELDVQVDKDTTVFLGRVHKDHADAFARILTDVVLHPRLDASDFARLRDNAINAIETGLRSSSDEALQREALEAWIYDAEHVRQATATAATTTTRHAYHHTPTGTVAALRALTLDDVRGHIARVFTADRLLVGVGGGASAAFVDGLVRALQALPPTSGPRTPAAAPAVSSTNELLVVDKAAAGTAISLGFALPTLSRSDPDYAAMKLAETWFGEHRNLVGHLFHSMREVRGLNYGDYAYVEHFVQDGWSMGELLNIPRRTQYFSMWIRPVEHKNRAFALRMAAWELQRFVDDGIPDDDSFTRVRSFVQGYWAGKEQEAMRRLGYALDDKLTGMPFDRAGLRARVATLTRAEVNAAIRRHLHADGLRIVVVTEGGDAFVQELLSRKPTPISYAGKVTDDVLAEDKQIERFDLHLDAAHVFVVKPDQLFSR